MSKADVTTRDVGRILSRADIVKARLKEELTAEALTTIVLSSISVVASLYASLKVLAETGSPFLQSLASFLFTLAYAAVSSAWRAGALSSLGARTPMLLSSALILLSSLILLLARVYWAILLALLFLASAQACLGPLLVSLFSERYRSGSETSLNYNMSVSLGSAAGYMLAGALAGSVDIGFVLVGGSFPLLYLALRLASSGRLEEVPRETMPKVITKLRLPRPFMGPLSSLPKALSIKARAFFRRVSLYMLKRYALTQLSILVFFIAVGLFFTPLPSVFKTLGLTANEIYLVNALFSFFSVLGFLAERELKLTFERLYRILVVAIAVRSALFVLPVVMLTFLETGSGLTLSVALMCLLGFTWAFIGVPMLGLLLYFAPRGEKSEAAGTFNALTSVGSLLGSLAATLLVRFAGLPHVYLASFMAALLSLLTIMRARSAILT